MVKNLKWNASSFNLICNEKKIVSTKGSSFSFFVAMINERMNKKN